MAWPVGIHSPHPLAVLVDAASCANGAGALAEQRAPFQRLKFLRSIRVDFMTHKKITIIVAGLSLLLFSSVVFGQETTANTKTVDTARRQKAVELLESLATQVTSLQSAENRARIGANIAESLWKDNENRARALFTSIEDDINSGFQNRDFKDPEDGLSVRVFLKLRGDTVQRIAKYDPEFALTFLSATAPQGEEIARMFTDEQRNLEVQLAKQIAATSPDIALKLGRQALARGFSVDLLPVLRQLHRKHRDKGVTLYKEAVQKVRDTDLTEDLGGSRVRARTGPVFRTTGGR